MGGYPFIQSMKRRGIQPHLWGTQENSNAPGLLHKNDALELFQKNMHPNFCFRLYLIPLLWSLDLWCYLASLSLAIHPWCRCFGPSIFRPNSGRFVLIYIYLFILTSIVSFVKKSRFLPLKIKGIYYLGCFDLNLAFFSGVKLF